MADVDAVLVQELSHFAHKDGTEIISRTPMVTGKGQRYFISKFLETKDQEALAAITEEELKLQSETDLFADSGNDFKPQLTADELNALDAEAEAVANNIVKSDELEDIDNDKLESIDNEDKELEAIDATSDELEAIDA